MKFLTSLLLALSLLAVSIPKNSEAAVGLIISSRSTRVVGGVMSVGGVGAVGAAIVANALLGNSYLMLGVAALGVVGAGVGLIVLDEKNADLKFIEIFPDLASQLGISEEDMKIYNTQIGDLNFVKDMIESQVTDKVTDEEIKYLWDEYQVVLAPETMQVASKVAQHLFQNH
jgi:hypothetical protein